MNVLLKSMRNQGFMLFIFLPESDQTKKMDQDVKRTSFPRVSSIFSQREKCQRNKFSLKCILRMWQKDIRKIVPLNSDPQKWPFSIMTVLKLNGEFNDQPHDGRRDHWHRCCLPQQYPPMEIPWGFLKRKYGPNPWIFFSHLEATSIGTLYALHPRPTSCTGVIRDILLSVEHEFKKSSIASVFYRVFGRQKKPTPQKGLVFFLCSG